MKHTADRTPNLLWSIAQCKCPHCRQGDMFKKANPYLLKSTLDMNERCAVCGTDFEPEIGFYFGTGYVSYGLCLAITAGSFLLYWLTLGFSFKDNSLFYWLGMDVAALVILQPVLMRLSRVIWLSFFTKFKKRNRTKAAMQ